MDYGSQRALWSRNHYELTGTLERPKDGGRGKGEAGEESCPKIGSQEAEKINHLLLEQIQRFLPNCGQTRTMAELAKWHQPQTLEYIENHPQEFLQFQIRAQTGYAFVVEATCDEDKMAKILRPCVFSQAKLAWGALLMWIISRGLGKVEHLMGLESQHDQLTRVTRLVGNTMLFVWNKKLQQGLDLMGAEISRQTGREASLQYGLRLEDGADESRTEAPEGDATRPAETAQAKKHQPGPA